MPPTRNVSSRTGSRRQSTRHKQTVYDAVAGRVAGFPSRWRVHPDISRTKAANLKQPAMPPDEVLFRSKEAPERYLEDDIYASDRHLPTDLQLPDSDLLKAIHAYTSDFYARQFPKDDYFVHHSMDETALLALGYLLEETVCQDLGETGDLALVEGRLPDEHPHLKRQAQAGFTHNDLPSIKDPPSLTIHADDFKKRKLGALRFSYPK